MTLDQHFAHLSKMLAPPFTFHWAPYVKERAFELAAQNVELEPLPAMVLAEFQRLKPAKDTATATVAST